MLVLLLVATAAVPAMMYLRIPILDFLAANPEAIGRSPTDPAAAQGATPVAHSEPHRTASSVSTSVGPPEVQPTVPPGPAIGVESARADLTISLSARGRCWMRATLDGTRRVERLLRRGETVTLNAREEIVLRVGNAGGVSLTINGLPAAPLGPQGEVVTARITRANYTRFTGQAQRPAG